MQLVILLNIIGELRVRYINIRRIILSPNFATFEFDNILNYDNILWKIYLKIKIKGVFF